MTSRPLQHALLRAASVLAPENRRAQWIKEWQSELWYIHPCQATVFCLGAFRDALWLHRNRRSSQTRRGIKPASPFTCLALLATLAPPAIFMIDCLLRTLPLPDTSRASLAGFISTMLIFYSPCAAVGFVLARQAANSHQWPAGLRGWSFLALKIALVLPVLQFCILATIWITPVAPFAPLTVDAACIFVFRWIFIDQHRRCPVCLRLLMEPVRIGSPSHTFLEWYGAESTCPRGHGLLHAPEFASSYSGNERWLKLDGSWKELFQARQL